MGEKKLLGTKEYLRGEIATLQGRIAELEAAQRWIPVGERLPISGVQVLGALRSTSGKYNLSRINYTSSATDHDWEADGFEIGNCWTVTHWNPLPTPPEEGE